LNKIIFFTKLQILQEKRLILIFDSYFNPMPFTTLLDYLPCIYKPLLPEVFSLEIPEESFTKCSDCMLICSKREDIGLDHSKPFAPDTKCCTFTPRLPNYLAGAFFADPDPMLDEGRRRLHQAITEHKGIFPQGIWPTKKYRLLYDAGRVEGFGRSLNMKCPYYLDGEFNCALWKYREGVCATWFCKHLAHKAGKEMWETVQEYIQTFQRNVNKWCIKELSAPNEEPYGENDNISLEDLDDLPTNSLEYSRRWGKWEGREEEFYMQCYRLVIIMNGDQLEKIKDKKLKALEEKLIERREVVMNIPEVLKRNPEFDGIADESGTYRIRFENQIERNNTVVKFIFGLPAFVLDSFDGVRNIDEVLESIKNKKGLQVHKEIIISLYHHGILCGD
jgi:hypothetical protein